MEPLVPTVPPEAAWDPIPAAEWTPETIRRLFRRAAFAARPQDVERAMAEQPAPTVTRLFAAQPPFQMPPKTAALAGQRGTMAERVRSATESERRQMREALREQARAAFDEFAVRWLERAADPQFSAGEKFVTFLENIFVVGAQKVRNPLLLFEHQALLREKGGGPYPDLCKAVSRSAAMIEYLDLQQSRAGQPNVNFARELFELFTLGGGQFQRRGREGGGPRIHRLPPPARAVSSRPARA